MPKSRRSPLRLIALAPLFLYSAAWADDAASAPGEPPSADWSGVYAGVHAGRGGAKTGWVFPDLGYFNLVPGEGFSINPDGGLAGGHLVITRQFGAWVVGLDASYSRAAISATRIGPVTPAYPEDRFETEIEDLLTLSGRLGYAFGRWQLHAKAGRANAEVSHNALSGPPGPGVIAAVGGRLNGYVLGGGVAYMVTPEVVLGVDYDFSRFASDGYATATTGAPPPTPFNLEAEDISMHAVSARISFRLGGWSPVEGAKD